MKTAAKLYKNASTVSRFSTCPINKSGSKGGLTTSSNSELTSSNSELTPPASPSSPPRGFHEVPRVGLLEKIQFIQSVWRDNIHVSVSRFHRKYGNIFCLDFPLTRPQVYILDPGDVSTLLSNDGKWPVTAGFDFFVYYRNKLRSDLYPGAKGLVGGHKEKWHSFRTQVQQIMMRPDSALFYLDTLVDITEDLGQALQKSKDPDGVLQDITPYLNRWALESIGSVFLDSRLGCLNENPTQEGKQLIQASHVVLGPENMWLSVGPPIWKYFKTPTLNRFDKATENLQTVCDTILKRVVADAAKKAASSESDTSNGKSLMTKLVEECGVDSDVPRVMAVDALMAGIDTTGYTATFLLYHVAKYPDVQERLYEEIVVVLAGGRLTPSKLNKMRYLKACQHESQRMLPATLGVGRRTQSEMVLGGYTVPAKTTVVYFGMINMLDCQHFNNPQEFRPERWIRGSSCRHSAHPFAHLPFGHGPRMCIGRRFAELELYVLVITLLQRFKLEVGSSEEVGVKSSFINKPDRPVKIRFRPR